jgi:peptidoglycan/LPS O-acetylase OafA/YrhL
MRPRSQFRPDIEGLRAVAVLGVVVGHALPSVLRAGFAGVDVFFVISGYLIGRHLLEDIQGGEFSLLRFYGRRARRILPALVIVLLAVWIGGWLLLAASEFSALGRHTAAAAIFANNILLVSESGYFDAAATAKPLLHLWSLGVEEQFYLVVPLLLWLGSRGRQASARWVLWCGLLSLLLAVLRAEPNYYLIEGRFWELAAGVVLGYLTLNWSGVAAGDAAPRGMGYRSILVCAIAVMAAAGLRCTTNHAWSAASNGTVALLAVAAGAAVLASTHSRRGAWQQLMALCRRHESLLRNIAGAGGLALVTVSFVALTTRDWPGPQTVFPVLGTLLIIAAGPAAVSNRLLGCRALVFIGGISYPLYLWHWPALVYARMSFPANSVLTVLAPVCLAMILAWATRELIENPVRAGRLFSLPVPAPPVWALLTAVVMSGLIGWSTVTTDGFPSRISPRLAAIADWTVPDPYGPWRVSRCYFQPGHPLTFAPECTPAPRPGVPRLLLWGDSHAAELYQGLVALRPQYDFDLVQRTAAGCSPTLKAFVDEQSRCPELRALVQRELTAIAPDTVLLVGAWERYLEEGAPPEAMLAAVGESTRWLQRSGVHHVVIFGPGPIWDATLPTDLFHYMRLRNTEQIPAYLGGVSSSVAWVDQQMAAQAATLGVQYVSIARYFCDSRGCRTLGDPAQQAPPDLLFRDRDHLTRSGAALLMEAAAPQIFGTALTARSAAN